MSERTRDQAQQSNGKPETSHHPAADPARKDKGYYGVPPIKHAHWTWQIPVYFWIGGIGAGVHLFSTIAQILGHKDEALTRTSRYTVLRTMILSPVLLIWDLGQARALLQHAARPQAPLPDVDPELVGLRFRHPERPDLRPPGRR